MNKIKEILNKFTEGSDINIYVIGILVYENIDPSENELDDLCSNLIDLDYEIYCSMPNAVTKQDRWLNNYIVIK